MPNRRKKSTSPAHLADNGTIAAGTERESHGAEQRFESRSQTREKSKASGAEKRKKSNKKSSSHKPVPVFSWAVATIFEVLKLGLLPPGSQTFIDIQILPEKLKARISGASLLAGGKQESSDLQTEGLSVGSRDFAPELAEIVARVSDWAGGSNQALAWCRSQPIPAFGDRTPESIVKSGQAEALRDYLDTIALGGFA
jgi:hypothetical protein